MTKLISDVAAEFLTINNKYEDWKRRNEALDDELINLQGILNRVDINALKKGELTGDPFLDAAICIASKRQYDRDFSLVRTPEIYHKMVREKYRIENARGLFIYDGTSFRPGDERGIEYSPDILFGRFVDPKVNVTFTDRSQHTLQSLDLIPKISITGYDLLAYFYGDKVIESPKDIEFTIEDDFRPKFYCGIVEDNHTHTGVFNLMGLHLQDELDNYLANLKGYSEKIGNSNDKMKSAIIHRQLSERLDRFRNCL